MNLSKLFFIISFISILFFSCNKDSSDNPSSSEIGTFYAELDGKDFYSTNKQTVAKLETTVFGLTMSIAGHDSTNEFFSFGFTISALPEGETIEEKTYQFSEDCTGNFCGYLTAVSSTRGIGTSLDGKGDLEITFTTVDFRKGGICKGTFSGTFTTINDGREVNVTKGRFNVLIE